ncbi:hypothetical protein [Acidithiobacillus ferrivorans]|uniref:hypothetical protein n=1 Tax=Acidithiobacillus ferrivorans TaxID=160808 RepID=UPI00067404EE|nr:hypothetical protein [Acidithiobacillus ferrivorans]MBU2765748.1 hypothetical protein [Acidithiobacillus ferrivorans]
MFRLPASNLANHTLAAYDNYMVIVESPVFTKAIVAILDDEGYRAMQNALVENPALGVVIPHGGGLRKVRWGVEGRGKRGGIRVIYYWWTGKGQI